MQRQSILIVSVIALMLSLAGCGGGGGGGGGNTGPINHQPLANAGQDQRVRTFAKIVLDGSRSLDEDADLISYDWSITSVPAGSNLTGLWYSNTAKAMFRPDVDGIYEFSLTVNDGHQSSLNPDSITVTASSTNSAPVAAAGRDQSVKVNSPVTLDGSGSSDADNNVLTYAWSFQAVPAAAVPPVLNGAATVNPSFTPVVEGDYVLSLVVGDGSLFSTTDTVTVTARTGNSPPVAHAGASQHVGIGSQVTLNGTGSADADSQDTLNYRWWLVSRPTGSAVTGVSNSSTASPNVTVDRPGVFVFGLSVSDGRVTSNVDTVSVNVYPSVASQLDSLRSAISMTPSQVLPMQSGNSGGISYTFQVLGYALCMPSDPYVAPLASSTLPETIYGCTNTVSPPSYVRAPDGSQVSVSITIPTIYIDLAISTSLTGNDSGYVVLTNVVVTNVLSLNHLEGNVYDYINRTSSNASHTTVTIDTSDSTLNTFVPLLSLVANVLVSTLDGLVQQAVDDAVRQNLLDSRGAEIP